MKILWTATGDNVGAVWDDLPTSETAPAARQRCDSGASPTIGASTVSDIIKGCTKCGRDLPLAGFAKSPVGAGGLRAECRECRAVADRDYLLQRRFGITAAEYDQLLLSQGGVCALCGTSSPGGRWTRFNVDHDHADGRVRGLLCRSCNFALGLLGDSPERLLRAYRYVAGSEVD